MAPDLEQYGLTNTRVGLLLDHLMTIGEKFQGLFVRRQFAEEIGARVTSDGPNNKLKDMVKVGLLVKVDRGYVISELGKGIINSGTGRTALIGKVIHNLPVWDKLLSQIGPEPDKTVFAKAFKELTDADDAFINENLGRLWYAYTDDVGCIKRSPPYSKWSMILKRSTKPQQTIKIVPPQPKNNSNLISSIEKETRISTPAKLKSPITYGTIEYKGHKFVINDELSYGFAEQIMRKIKKDLETELGVSLEL